MAAKKHYHYQIRHDLLLESITGMGNAGGKVELSTGVYYVVPLVERWVVMAYRYADVTRELDHVHFWEGHIVSRLAANWSSKVGVSFYRLRDILEEHPYAFPRGRVVRVDGANHVYHGDDLPDALGVKRETIETIFGIDNAIWLEDDHEHCLEVDQAALRSLLFLKECWPAV